MFFAAIPRPPATWLFIQKHWHVLFALQFNVHYLDLIIILNLNWIHVNILIYNEILYLPLFLVKLYKIFYSKYFETDILLTLQYLI